MAQTRPDGRHSLEWYEAVLLAEGMRRGDRIFVPCEGGPCVSRLETFPPRLEIEERGGIYALDDDGALHEWRYLFVPTAF